MIAPGVVVSAVGLGALSVGPESGWSVFAGDALYLIGMGMGIWEVSMDVVGARVFSAITPYFLDFTPRSVSERSSDWRVSEYLEIR